MSRRDTIIISVLINAALLVVLFITAAVTRDNSTIDASDKVATSKLLEETTIEAKELFSSDYESKSNVAKKEPEKVEQKEFIALKDESEKITKKEAEKNIVYKLPNIEKNVVEKKLPVKQLDFFEITVKKGDTLERLALVNKAKVSEIVEINNLPNSFLRIGQKLLIPRK